MSDGYTIITDASEIDRTEWKNFVLTHPLGNIFQTPEYYDLCFSVPDYRGSVTCFRVEEGIKGIMVSMIQREYSGLAGYLTARSIIWGGPLVHNNDESIIRIILEAYDKDVREQALFTQVRNLSDVSYLSGIFNTAGFKFEDHLNILIDLNKGKENLWSDIHPTRRKQINRSKRREVNAGLSDPSNMDVIESCYEILRKNYRREGLPLPVRKFFEKASQLFMTNQSLKIFTAEYNSEIIGFRIVLCFKDSIYDWYAGSKDEHLDKYPNDLLPWKILDWGVDNGFKLFDFGGAGKPGKPYGVRDYKIKFGGETVNYGRYNKVHKPLAYLLIMSLFRIRKMIISWL